MHSNSDTVPHFLHCKL